MHIIKKALVVVGFLCVSVASSAATIWTPTNENVNIVQIDVVLSLNGGSLALFENGDALTAANALVLGTSGGLFEFTDIGSGNYQVEAFVGIASQGTKVLNGDDFVLGVDWGNGFVSDSSYTQSPSDATVYTIAFNDGVNSGTSLAVDLALSEVPLPAAAWLFGSALLGLTAISRRRRPA